VSRSLAHLYCVARNEAPNSLTPLLPGITRSSGSEAWACARGRRFVTHSTAMGDISGSSALLGSVPRLPCRSAEEVDTLLKHMYGERYLEYVMPRRDVHGNKRINVIHVTLCWENPETGKLHSIRIHERSPKSELDFFVLNAIRAASDLALASAKLLRDEPHYAATVQGSSAAALCEWRTRYLGKPQDFQHPDTAIITSFVAPSEAQKQALGKDIDPELGLDCGTCKVPLTHPIFSSTSEVTRGQSKLYITMPQSCCEMLERFVRQTEVSNTPGSHSMFETAPEWMRMFIHLMKQHGVIPLCINEPASLAPPSSSARNLPTRNSSLSHIVQQVLSCRRDDGRPYLVAHVELGPRSTPELYVGSPEQGISPLIDTLFLTVYRGPLPEGPLENNLVIANGEILEPFPRLPNGRSELDEHFELRNAGFTQGDWTFYVYTRRTSQVII